jgi:hypothetical protein
LSLPLVGFSEGSVGRDAALEAQHLTIISVPVLAVRPGVVVADGRVITLFQLDMTARPDLRDLPRLHRLEGPGSSRIRPILSFGQSGAAIIFVRTTLETPVRCRFVLRLDSAIDRDRLAIELLATSGLFGIMPDPLDVPGDPNLTAFETDPSELEAMLSTIEVIEALNEDFQRRKEHP